MAAPIPRVPPVTNATRDIPVPPGNILECHGRIEPTVTYVKSLVVR
jgi:hypothetical protein